MTDNRVTDFFKKPFAWAGCFASILTLFTLYAVLDTFVIPRRYAVVRRVTSAPPPSSTVSETTAATGTSEPRTQTATEPETTVPATTEVKATDTAYSAPGVEITLAKYREYDTEIYVADIYLESAESLRAAFADDVFGKNVTAKTSATAEAHGAALAINGDYYGAQNKGYVVRNGTLYRSTAYASDREDLVIYGYGGFEIIREGDITAEKLVENGALHVFSFGPGLVIDGESAVSPSDEVAKASVSNPRTAIGMIEALHYVMVVSDGRTSESAGLSLSQLAEFMLTLGATQAYNLDGGGSSTMYFNGKVVNNPTTNGKKITERSVSDIVYIGA